MNNKARDKFISCYKMVLALSPLYNGTDNETERAFMETTIGAAIFYLPTQKAIHFTGYVSEEVLNGGKAIKEHLYPRKVSGSSLLSNPPATLEEFIKVCNDKYLSYNFTTATENKRLVPYQKMSEFVSPETSYELAKITLVKIK